MIYSLLNLSRLDLICLHIGCIFKIDFYLKIFIQYISIIFFSLKFSQISPTSLPTWHVLFLSLKKKEKSQNNKIRNKLKNKTKDIKTKSNFETTQKTKCRVFVLANSSWAWSLPWSVLVISSATHWRKRTSFPSSCQLQKSLVSGRTLCPPPLLSVLAFWAGLHFLQVLCALSQSL